MVNHLVGGAEPVAIRVGLGSNAMAVVKVLAGNGTATPDTVWPLGPTIVWADNFDRASLGAGWLTRGQAPVIRSNALSAASTGSNTRRSGNASPTVAMPTDDIRVAVKLSTVPYVDQRSGIQISGALDDSGGDPSEYVGVELGLKYILIFTRIGGTYVNRITSTAYTFAVGDLVEFERKGNTFTVYQNGVSRLSWTGTVPSGAARRYISFGMVSQYPIFQQVYYSANFGEAYAYTP